MRVALVADVFPPLRSSGAIQLRDLATEFARQGHHITVMISTPALERAWEVEGVAGVEVLRLRSPSTRDRGYVARTVGEFFMPYFMLYGFRRSPLANVIFDAVIWYSPTIFLGPIVKALKKQSKCPAYLIIRDIFPEWAKEMGLIRSKLVYRCFKWVANYQYAQADIIGIQTPGNQAYFECWQHEHPNAQIEVLHNWLSPAPNVGSTIHIERTKLKGRKILVYAGNMGVAQNTKVFLELAKRLNSRSDIGFLFVGRGSESGSLSDQYGELDNVLFHDEIDPSEIAGLYAQCAVGLVALDPRHQSHNIPGKFLSYMQAGLPVLACVNRDNDLVALIKSHNVGVVVDAHSPDRMESALVEMLSWTATHLEVAERCRLLSLRMFSSESAVRQIVVALNKVIYLPRWDKGI